ncbi:hypothetical protein HDU96_002574 [Phlyctochytrium bullatum]|nr:hypothetical protein HDU96_002574 [Phlyctochytrium bullatum]
MEGEDDIRLPPLAKGKGPATERVPFSDLREYNDEPEHSDSSSRGKSGKFSGIEGQFETSELFTSRLISNTIPGLDDARETSLSARAGSSLSSDSSPFRNLQSLEINAVDAPPALRTGTIHGQEFDEVGGGIDHREAIREEILDDGGERPLREAIRMPPDVDDGPENRPMALNVNVAVEVGPNGIAAEVQAQGDINAFLELVGMQGPIENLGQNMITVVLVIVAAIGAGVWLPFITGKALVWIVTDVYTPIVDSTVAVGTKYLQAFTDPLLDPLADGVIVVLGWAGFGNLMRSNLTITTDGIFNATDNLVVTPSSKTAALLPTLEAILNHTDSTAILNDSDSTSLEILEDEVSTPKHLEVPSSNHDKSGQTKKGIDHRDKDSKQFVEVREIEKILGLPSQLGYTLIGYITHLSLLYYHARRSGRLDHPYAQTMKRILYKWLVYLSTAIKARNVSDVLWYLD